MGLFGLFKKKKNDKAAPVNEVAKEEIKAEEPVLDTKEIAEPEVKREAAPDAVTTKNIEDKKEEQAEMKKEEKKPAEAKTTEKKVAEKKPTPKKVEAAKLAKADPKPAPAVKEEPVEEQAPVTDAIGANYTGKFEINKSKDGKKFFFNLYASNKVGIATSQMYSSAQSALGGIKSVIANAEKAPVEDQSLKSYNPEDALPYPKWEIYVDNGGKFRFRLNASNGSCVCHSQGYTTKAACKNGIDSIIRSSKNAEIDKTYINKEDK